MNTVKILHCADLHIGAKESFLEEKAELRRREIILTFEKIVDLAVENSVDLLLIAGDLFDSNNIPTSLIEPILNKIQTAHKLRVVYAAGNHDPLNSQSPFERAKIPENLYILKPEQTVITFPKIGANIYGRSFEAAFCEGLKGPAFTPENYDFINIGVLHGEITSDLNSRYNPITKGFIESSNLDYLALGHIHKRSEIEKSGNTFFAYSGCPEGQGFDELETKGVLMGEIGKNICNLEFIPTAKRQHCLTYIDVTNCEGSVFNKIINTLKENYGENFSENLYKIHLIGEASVNLEINLSDLEARISEQVYFAKIKDLTTPEINLSALAEEKSLKGIFVKKMLLKIEETKGNKLYKDALKLGLKAFDEEIKFNEN